VEVLHVLVKGTPGGAQKLCQERALRRG